MRTTSSPLSTAPLNVSTYRKPLTGLPTSDGSGVMVTLIVPDCPGPSTSGLKVLVPSMRSAQMLPLSVVTRVSKGCMSATASVSTGTLFGAPFGGYGPISDGTISHGPHGISGSTMDAATVSGPAALAHRSGLPVTPTPLPASLKASIVMGEVDCAMNLSAETSGGTHVSSQAPSKRLPQSGAAPRSTTAGCATRVSAK